MVKDRLYFYPSRDKQIDNRCCFMKVLYTPGVLCVASVAGHKYATNWQRSLAD